MGYIRVLKFRRVRGLRYAWIGELIHRKRFGTVFAAVEIPCLGVGDIQLLAQLVKTALLGDLRKHGVVVAGDDEPFVSQMFLSCGEHERMTIVAAQQQGHGFRILGPKL